MGFESYALVTPEAKIPKSPLNRDNLGKTQSCIEETGSSAFKVLYEPELVVRIGRSALRKQFDPITPKSSTTEPLRTNPN